jgi:hypothetical protein
LVRRTVVATADIPHPTRPWNSSSVSGARRGGQIAKSAFCLNDRRQ